MPEFVEAEDPLLASLRRFILDTCDPPVCVSSSPQDAAPAGRSVWVQEVDCMRLLSAHPSLGTRLFYDTVALLEQLRASSAAVCVGAGRPVCASELSMRLTHVPTVGAPPPALPPPRGVLWCGGGAVVRLGARRVVPAVRRFLCAACGASSAVPSDCLDRTSAPAPRCDCRGEAMRPAGQRWMDYAEGRLQPRAGRPGRLPRSLGVALDDDLSGACAVGQLVEVAGVVFPRWRAVCAGARPLVDPTLWAVAVRAGEAERGGASAARHRRSARTDGDGPAFSPESFFASFCKERLRRGAAIAQSVCPQLCGLFAPRFAVLLSSLGGAVAGRHRGRASIHCLLVGDPSTGKSQMLRAAAQLAPRSTATTGVGSTSAGLTVAAAKENGEWVLEPGALVLSDGGVCVIDELRTVSPADRAALHEAMEQQTISVAKAGMVTRLRTACAVVAACNPPTRRGHANLAGAGAVAAEVGVGGPLLSRFDFIFLLWDRPLPKEDHVIATHILACAQAGRQPRPPLTADELARYLRWVRAHYAKAGGPLLSDSAAALLHAYYDLQQRRGAAPSLADGVPVTVRLLESLVRITQAHAKLHLEHICGEEDAAMTIFLMEQSAHSLKCPLESLGPDVYSCSKFLSTYFLDSTEDGVRMQREVLRAIANVFGRCVPPVDGAAPHLLEPFTSPSKGQKRARSGGNHLNNNDDNDPVARSARRIEREVSLPFSTAQTVCSYAPSVEAPSIPPLRPTTTTTTRHRRDADEIMRSLTFQF